MKQLELKIKRFPPCECLHTVEQMYKQNIDLVFKKKKIHLHSAKTIAVACHLGVEDFIVDMLSTTDNL